jgi:hypothetical protein
MRHMTRCSCCFSLLSALKVPDAALMTVDGAESADAEILNRRFEAIHNAEMCMNVGTFFDAYLYGDEAWQAEHGVRNEDTNEVHALPFAWCVRAQRLTD